MKQQVSSSDISLRKQLDTRGIGRSLEGRHNVTNKRLAEFILCSVISEIRKHEAAIISLSLTPPPTPILDHTVGMLHAPWFPLVCYVVVHVLIK